MLIHLLQRGYKAALPYKEYFRKLADSLNRIGTQKPIENILDKQTYTFDKIEITGNKIILIFRYLEFWILNLEKRLIKIMLSDKNELLYGKAGLKR